MFICVCTNKMGNSYNLLSGRFGSASYSVQLCVHVHVCLLAVLWLHLHTCTYV